MPKEDRSDWVAVAPQFATTNNNDDKTSSSTTTLVKAKSAFQWFQKERANELKHQVRVANHGTFTVALLAKTTQAAWQALSATDRKHFEDLAASDAARYAAEAHQADVAALERSAQLQAQRQQESLSLLLLDTQTGSGEQQQRTTRRAFEKKQKKEARRQQQQQQRSDPTQKDHAGDSSASASSSSEDDDKKKKKKASRTLVLSQKQLEYQARQKAAKQEKEAYIAQRQADLRRDKAQQAKRRLEFLLQQSDIFAHFGRVKQDTAKYGILATTTTTTTTTAATATTTSAAVPASLAEDPTNPKTSRTSKSRRDDAAAAAGAASTTTTSTDEQDLADADEHEATFLTTQPTSLGFGKMRPYQLEGLNWMIRLQENGVNGILADEMGLGKTLQSISVLVYMHEYRNETGPHLIVVPKSTLSNWMNEIARWAPTLTAVKFHGDRATREEIVRLQLEPAQKDEDRTWNVLVTTYEVCNIEKNVLKKFAWNYLIIDEAHRLKNEASAFSQTIRSFETKFRLLLTGTPLQNSLHELWALLNFLVPDVFESSEQFDEWFNLDIEDNDEKNKLISQLHKILRPFMLRRLKADVEKSLPPKHETILFTGMSAVQKKLYRDILMRDLDALQGASGSRTAILNIVMQLRKCAGHPYLFPGVEDRTLPPLGEHLVENCGKMVLLDKLLRRLKERGHRVLLFTQMTRILDILEDYLVMRRFSYCRIDGNTSYDDRESYIDDYNKPDSDKFLFLLSTRAGGLGINLQTADVVILYDSDWNPQADLQAQDRAHRIGQKREVQVFRLVTEHTVEEKIVERAQQKLKLDAMVVQQGRLKDKDKLSRDELLTAVRFGADTIFKSKDSSITDDDIDMILDQGKKKTEEMNEKLKAADKGDMLDFKLDGSSVQTFEGVDYSTSALAQQAKAQAMLGIFDIGKRERKEANYNENTIYQRQIAALQGSGPKKPKKKKEIRLPVYLRLPRMHDWQMYDRETLLKISEDEEAAFRALPEEQQKAAVAKKTDAGMPDATNTPDISTAPMEEDAEGTTEAPAEIEAELPTSELPPLISEEQQAQKDKLLAEGFSTWSRLHYNAFLRASARHGRDNYALIAVDVGKTEEEVRQYAEAFWGVLGSTRIPAVEYDRATKAIERGEKKINETTVLERATRIFVSLFDNPWDELQFTHVNCKDKMYTAEEDRHLLCWARKYGHGQWMAIKMAVRRNPNFRFDYFLRSLPVELLGKRCEQLMNAAKKEVDYYEKITREAAGLPTEAEEGQTLPPIELPKFRVLQRKLRASAKHEHEKTRKELQDRVTDLEAQIAAFQDRLKEINGGAPARPAPGRSSATSTPRQTPVNVTTEVAAASAVEKKSAPLEKTLSLSGKQGALGADGSFVEFPEYNGNEAPTDWKKPFTQFCLQTRRQVKASLDPEDRRDKKKVNGILKERWIDMTEDEKDYYRRWTEWDKKRFAHEQSIFDRHCSEILPGGDGGGGDMSDDEAPAEMDGTESLHVPKKKRSKVVNNNNDDADAIPRKKRKS